MNKYNIKENTIMAVKVVPETPLPRCSKCGYRKMIHIINGKEYLHCEHCEPYDQIIKDYE